jgi:hypothetical protein
MLLIISFQNALFAATTTVYGVAAGYRRIGRAFEFVSRRLNLENLLILGAVLTVLGLIVTGHVFLDWSTQGFGALDRIREMIGGVTLIVIGFQSFFGGFLLAIIAGNVANIYDVVKPKTEQWIAPNSVTVPFTSDLNVGS